MKKLGVLGLAAIAAVAAFGLVRNDDRFAEVRQAVGKPLPAFQMTTLDDKKVTNKDFEGKVLVIDFWATWCGPCRAAAPTLQKLHEEFAEKGLVMIGANTNERTPGKDNAVNYVKETGYTYLFTYGNEHLVRDWKVPGFPTFFIVDRKGVVREVMVGFQADRMRSLIQELL